jgi:uncharacterized membrane protein (UPF0127 family)
MVLESLTYYDKGKKTKINVQVCKSILCKFLGLMFKSKSPPLFFIFKKEKTLSIHSFFCKPFKAIWLDENKQVTKIQEIKNYKLNISGRGKYLLEVLVGRRELPRNDKPRRKTNETFKYKSI